MKIKKLIIAILSALALTALAVSLSACDFIDGIFGNEPQTPPAQEQPDDNPDDNSDDNPGACSHEYGEWQDVINTCTVHTQKRVCSECNSEEIISVTPKGHSYGPWTDRKSVV